MNSSLFALLQNLLHLMRSGINTPGDFHPFFIHFPVALLLIAPFFILLSFAFPSSAKSFFISSLILMWIGTLSVFLSVSTGEIASELIVPSPGILKTLELHEDLATESRFFFSILTILLTVGFFSAQLFRQKLNKRIQIFSTIIFLLFYCGALVILLSAAHQGAILVHKHGIKSSLYQKLE